MPMFTHKVLLCHVQHTNIVLSQSKRLEGGGGLGSLRSGLRRRGGSSWVYAGCLRLGRFFCRLYYLCAFLMLAVLLVTLLNLCVSSLRRGHANLLCIVPTLTDDPGRESDGCFTCCFCRGGLGLGRPRRPRPEPPPDLL